jgi:hypothetical protein
MLDGPLPYGDIIGIPLVVGGRGLRSLDSVFDVLDTAMETQQGMEIVPFTMGTVPGMVEYQ